MKFKIQLTIVNPDDGKESTEEITLLDKQNERLEDIGLSLQESKNILKSLQEKIVNYQTDDFVQGKRSCGKCQKSCRIKGSHPIVFRTLFGDLPIKSQRFYTCDCTEQEQKTFSPLKELLTDYTSPEKMYLETKWASTIPFGKTVNLLKDVLPISNKLSASTVGNHLHKVAQKEESELKEKRFAFVEGCQLQWDELPRPDGTIVVGLDGGYLRSWENKKKHFEVIAGKSIPRDQADKFFAFVDTYEPSKPKRRLYEVLKSQGMQFNQEIEFLSDGATNLHQLQRYLNPLSKHYLDWFHITMKITVLKQYLKGILKVDKDLGEEQLHFLEKVKWYLWHGNIHKALTYLSFLEDVESLECEYTHWKGFQKHAAEFISYIKNNKGLITNYGERYQNGEIFTTSFTESTINEVVARRFCKKQQMQWSKKGAHLLLVTRAKVLNGELVDCFKKWYPNLKIEQKEVKKAA